MVALGAILATVAVPSLSRLSAKERVVARTNGLLGALRYARGMAVRRGRRVIICGRTQDGDCSDATGQWKYGWLVFINQDGTYPPHVDDGDQLLRVRKGGDQASAAVISNRRYFEFTGRGTAITNICVNKARSIKVPRTGMSACGKNL